MTSTGPGAPQPTLASLGVRLRVPLTRRMSHRQMALVAMLASGYSAPECAATMGLAIRSIREHIERAAAKVPGGLPPIARLIAWYRGADLFVLTGQTTWDEETLPKQIRPLAQPLAGSVASAHAAAADAAAADAAAGIDDEDDAPIGDDAREEEEDEALTLDGDDHQ